MLIKVTVNALPLEIAATRIFDELLQIVDYKQIGRNLYEIHAHIPNSLPFKVKRGCELQCLRETIAEHSKEILKTEVIVIFTNGYRRKVYGKNKLDVDCNVHKYEMYYGLKKQDIQYMERFGNNDKGNI